LAEVSALVRRGGQVRSELTNINLVGSRGAVVSHEQLRSGLANKTSRARSTILAVDHQIRLWLGEGLGMSALPGEASLRSVPLPALPRGAGIVVAAGERDRCRP